MKQKRYRIERTFTDFPKFDNRQFVKNMSLEYCKAMFQEFKDNAQNNGISPLYEDDVLLKFGKEHSIFGPVTFEIVQIK